MDAATDAPRGVLETRDVSPAALARRLRTDVLQSGRIAPAVPAVDRGHAYVLPWRDKEPVLTGGGRAPVPIEAEETRAFLAHVPTGAQLLFGYPLMVDADGRLAPLLFTSVVMRREADNRPVVAIAPGWKVRVNHAPLARAGFDAAARERLVDALEHGSFSGLRGFLDHAAGVLGLDLRFVPDALSGPPDGPLPTGWHDHPALILPATDGDTTDSAPGAGPGPALPGPALRADLDRIAAGGETATGRTDALDALTTEAPEARAPTVMPIEPLDVGIGNVPALEVAATAPLSLVQAVDPATAAAFAVDLLAGTVVDGQTVLYVAPDAAGLDALEGTLAAVLGAAAGRMIRLDRPGLRPRAPASRQTPEPLDGTPPLPSPTLAELAEKRRAAGEAAASAERLRAAHRNLADIHRRRIGLEALTDPAWRPLFAPDYRLGIDLDTVIAWQARLSGREPVSGRGLARLVKRSADHPEPSAAVAALVEALAPVPGEVVARLPVPDDTAEPEAMRHAFDQLARRIKWHEALQAEIEQEAAIEREAAASDLARHAGRARTAVVEMSRRLLPDRWGTVAGIDAEGDRQLADALGTLLDRRVSDAGADDAGRDRAIVKALAKALGRFPLILATPDDVARRLPLVPGLVGLAVVDRAEMISAAALPPLLARARRACVIGRSAASAGFSDAAGLAADARGVRVLRLDDRTPRAVGIAAYLAERAGGGWSPSTAGGDVVVDLPDSALGLRRHAPPDLGRHGEIAAAIDLLRAWKTQGLFDLVPRPTMAVISPLPDDADRLGRALKAVVPTSAAERSVLVGTPADLAGRQVDLLILMPGLLPPPIPERARELAASAALYLDAVRAARAGVHVIAARDPALEAGGHLAALVAAADARRRRYGSARDMLATLAETAGLPFEPTGDAPTAFGPFGTVYRPVFRDEPETAAALLIAAEGLAGPGAAPLPVLLDRDTVIDRPENALERLRRLA